MPDAARLSTYCFVANCKLVVGSCVTVTDVKPTGAKDVAPNAMLVVPSVIELFVNALFGIFVNVFDAPLIDLPVNVCVPVSVTTLESMAIVTAEEPLYEVPDNPVPMVNAFKLEPSATPEMVEFANEALAMFVSVLSGPLIVLLVSVCVPVSVATTVSSIVIVPVDVIGPPSKPVPVATDVTPEPEAKDTHAPFK